jgi:hypothetical protein
MVLKKVQETSTVWRQLTQQHWNLKCPRYVCVVNFLKDNAAAPKESPSKLGKRALKRNDPVEIP